MLSVIENFKTGKLELAELPAPVVRPGFFLVANRASLISAGTERAAIDLAQKSLAGKALARPDLVRQVLNKVRRDGLAATIATVRAQLDSPLRAGLLVGGRRPRGGEGARRSSPSATAWHAQARSTLRTAISSACRRTYASGFPTTSHSRRPRTSRSARSRFTACARRT